MTDPISDPTRLEALRRLPFLDGRPEPEFDRITRFAARLLHTPMAMVTVIEADRQVFKSAIGLPEPWATVRETPLSHSICRHVVASGSPLAIQDARQHLLVCHSPAVAELGLIAYLGSPLRLPDGPILGALCVADASPRDWSAEEVGMLEELAAWVMAETGRRSSAIERRQGEAEREEAVLGPPAAGAPVTPASPETRRFISFLTHEISTPLTVIQGFSEMIRDEPLRPEEIREYAADIHKEATHLCELIARVRRGDGVMT